MGKKSNNRGKRATTLSVGSKRGFRSTGRGKVGGVGGKSKTKKAKAVKKTLKNINLLNRSKIDNVDKDLVKLRESVRNVSSASSAGAVANNRSRPKPGRKGGNTAAALAKREREFRELQKDKEDGVKKLDNMDIGK